MLALCPQDELNVVLEGRMQEISHLELELSRQKQLVSAHEQVSGFGGT
jgi:hypothetical protein